MTDTERVAEQLKDLVAWGAFSAQKAILKKDAITALPQVESRLPDYPTSSDLFGACIGVVSDEIDRIELGTTIYVRGDSVGPKWEKQLTAQQVRESLRTLLELPASGKEPANHRNAIDRRGDVIGRLGLTRVTDATKWRRLGPELQLMRVLAEQLTIVEPADQGYLYLDAEVHHQIDRNGVLTRMRVIQTVKILEDGLDQIGPIGFEHLGDRQSGVLTAEAILPDCEVTFVEPFPNRSLILMNTDIATANKNDIRTIGYEVSAHSDIANPPIIYNRYQRGIARLACYIDFEVAPKDVWWFQGVMLELMIPSTLPSESARVQVTNGRCFREFKDCQPNVLFGFAWSPPE